MSEICTDGRFELIAAYKQKLIERTNIETSAEEMAVIDNILFRFWQMGWLPPLPHGRIIDADALQRELWKARRSYQLLDDTQTADIIMHGFRRAECLLDDAPTIIPADKNN